MTFKQIITKPWIVIIISAVLSALPLTFDSLFLLSWFLFVILSAFISSEAICYFIVAWAISTYSEIMARVLKTPTTTFITAALIPLIPGGSLYYTMANAFHGNMEGFLQKAIYTLQLSAALALGIIVSTTLFNILQRIIKSKSAEKQTQV